MLKEWFGIDDVCDAAPVHMFCGAWCCYRVSACLCLISLYVSAGIWGVLAPGLFSQDPSAGCGIFYASTPTRACVNQWEQLGAQLVFVIVIILWVGFTAGVMFFGLKHMDWLRVSKEIEITGMDTSKHGGEAYEHQQFERRMENTIKRQTSFQESATKLDQLEGALVGNADGEFRKKFFDLLSDPEMVEEMKRTLGKLN